jgi:hypothetical protein
MMPFGQSSMRGTKTLSGRRAGLCISRSTLATTKCNSVRPCSRSSVQMPSAPVLLCRLVHYNQSRVNAALLDVELSLQRPQNLIINLPLVPQPDKRLTLHEKNR